MIVRVPHTRATAPDAPFRRGRRFAWLRLTLVLTDILTLNAALVSGWWLRMHSGLFEADEWHRVLGSGHWVAMQLFAITFFCLDTWLGLYRREVMAHTGLQTYRIGSSAVLGALAIVSASYAFKSPYFIEKRSILLLGIGLFAISRIALRALVVGPWLLGPSWRLPALIVGTSAQARAIAEQLAGEASLGYDPQGYVGAPDGRSPLELPWLGTIDDIEKVVEGHGTRAVFLALPDLRAKEVLELGMRMRALGLDVCIAAESLPRATTLARAEAPWGIPLFALRSPAASRAEVALKRVLDVAGSAIALCALAPLMVFSALLVRFSSRGPVLFSQERVGRDGRPFQLLKFRTMYEGADDGEYRDYMQRVVRGEAAPVDDGRGGQVHKPVADGRITPAGRFLRRWSLDELPQLLNVLRGEMSLVGPRPPLAFEVEAYEQWHKRRLAVRPGITGLWQVSGRTRTGFENMAILDICYIESWSLGLDISILLRTVPAVISGIGSH